ncbi:MAG: o-succinylbenzoate synthase [Bacteroidetes bacterium]|nr:MAG: o-succinylbenzoate synthase [Bacteroidota bacterium]
MEAFLKKIELKFITPGQTSRGTLYTKPSWFLILQDGDRTGVGECSVIPGLNPEYDNNYEEHLDTLIRQINHDNLPPLSTLDTWPSVRFGLEMALKDLNHSPCGVLFPSDFTRGKEGIPINGLIWMGSIDKMQQRIQEKLDQGFKVLKLKVGALDFEEEISLLENIRSRFPTADLEIRLDANGAFSPENALEKLERLADYHIHSIEQPIQPGQWDEMSNLCEKPPIPIALDEELIGIHSPVEKLRLLEYIRPQYIILKPSLVGGFEKSKEWIDAATATDTGWWATSALESNIGLSAIAQWVYTLKPNNVQGLGTGGVFSNNLPSSLYLQNSTLFFDAKKSEADAAYWKSF